ncbi:MAG: ATP-dependent Clp protease ATP-binding subunit [Saprospirales bacterium]|nr:ATP-dependent Clp protease ATP-binding subunit [Saprospirales bacterium]MBK8492861.1 ATP-dependent Clp protease ATP-binding subunit [Saprospirales bacterium]
MAIENLSFPLLYFQLSDEAVLGILLGTRYQVMEHDLRKLKKSLTDYLTKQYKKTASYPENDLHDASLRIIQVKIPPTYRHKGKAFQMTNQVEIPVTAVVGKSSYGYFECYFPLLEEEFIFYDPQRLHSLIKSFATNILYSFSPEELHQMAQMPLPELDQIELRVNTERDPVWKPFYFEQRSQTLERLAEPFPSAKGARPHNAFPEAAWEMEGIVEQVIEKLAHQRANVLLVGSSGVGKSAVLKQAMRKIHTDSKRQKRKRTFWRIMAQRITATTKYLGEWQELVEELIQELKWTNGILWVEDVLQLLTTGGSGVEDSVAAFIQSYIRQGDLQIVAEVTPVQLDRLRQLLPGFAELFQVIEIAPMDERTVLGVLEKFATYTQQTQEISFSNEVLQIAFRLLKRYYPYEQFPGKGIKFLAQCVNEARINEQKKIGKEEVLRQFSQQTGLPEIFLRDDLLLDQPELLQYFHSRIIGQEEAVTQLCNIVKIYKAGLNNPAKPITTLLFAGPTGVGKTASAQALADYFFGKGQLKRPLVRIDMSEFQIPGDLSRLIGEGKEVGQVVKEIRERPFSVLLLDEVEKAHSSIYDALLTVLDEGVLVDTYGRVTDFRNTIIILTTNLGQNQKSIGFKSTTSTERQFTSAVEKYFRPEFINRLDQMVLFNSLDKEHIEKIAEKELKELALREGIAKYQIRLQYSPKLLDHLVQVGFDERYGARPLQRALEQNIVYPLAGWLVRNPIPVGQTLFLDFEGEDLKVKVTP